MATRTQRKARATPSPAELRAALAEYIRTEGCSCCQDTEGHSSLLAALKARDERVTALERTNLSLFEQLAALHDILCNAPETYTDEHAGIVRQLLHEGALLRPLDGGE